ncbi:MAG: hypothetical protein ACYC7E_02000 [Armatimonadota bacterium]
MEHSESLVPLRPLVSEEVEQTTDRKSTRWNFKSLLLAFIISLVLQQLFLPCMCYEGSVKLEFAMWFDAFVLLRILVAWVFKERGRSWLFYAVVLYTSPIWITMLVSYFAHR